MYLSYSRTMIECTIFVEVMVRGYHVYKDIGTAVAVIDEELICQRESFNSADPFIVAVKKENTLRGKYCLSVSVFKE